MNYLEEKNWHKVRASASKLLFEQVQERVKHKQAKKVKTHQQLTTAVILLLLATGLNIIIAINLPKKLSHEVELLLYETYFDNTLKFENEK